MCREGEALALELRWPGSGNARALGAVARLRVGDAVLARRVDATAGYLSGGAARLHFGVPAGAAAEALEIVWPDGATSRIDAPAPGARLVAPRREGVR